MLVEEIQDYVGRFSEEVNTKSSFALEDIVVKEGKPEEGILMSTSKGVIYVHNTAYSYPPGSLEHHVLHELGHRLADSIREGVNQEMTYKVAYHMSRAPPKKGFLEKLQFEMEFIRASAENVLNNPGCIDVSKSLIEGVAEYLAIVVLANVYCSPSQECKDFGKRRAADFLDHANYLKILDRNLKKNTGRGLKTIKEAFDGLMDARAMLDRARKGEIGQLREYKRRLIEYRTRSHYSLGFNFYFRMSQMHNFSLVLKFLKEPYVYGDPRLDLERLIHPKGFIGHIARTRN